jgi:hypothetical protein
LKPVIRSVQLASKRFKALAAAQDQAGMALCSEFAWNSLASLFEMLRNEEDQNRLDRRFMSEPTAYLVNGASATEQAKMIAARKIDRSHLGFKRIGLRDALNKIAHHDTERATYRIDGRGAHYMVLGGTHQRRQWVAEILISVLCQNAAAAAAAIR